MKPRRFALRLWRFGARPLGVLLAVAALGSLTANPLPTVFGVLAVAILFWLLWTPGEPPALLFAAGFQWLQVFMPVLQADLNVQRLSDPPLPNLETAAWLGMASIVVLAAGMRFGLGVRLPSSKEGLDPSVLRTNVKRLATVYALTFVASVILVDIGAVMPSIRQFALALAALRWVVVFLILWLASQDRKYLVLAFVMVAIETVVGFGGFFGGFKFVLFLGILALLGKREGRIPLFRPGVLVTGALILLLGVYWQAVKVGYRAYLNQDTGGQVVLVTPGERYSYLADRTARLDMSDMQAGFDSAMSRVGYLEFFARVIGQVPTVVPYQDGRLWGEAFTRVLTPRVLFPGKSAVNDSLRTAEFTGDRTLGLVQGTSVSIGYVGESYIDFGPIAMFLPVLGVGWFWGRGYRWLATRKAPPLLGVSTAIVFVMSGGSLFEMSNINVLGGGLTSLIVSTFALRYFGRSAWRALVNRPPARVRRLFGVDSPEEAPPTGSGRKPARA
jgi:hypothetical protein